MGPIVFFGTIHGSYWIIQLAFSFIFLFFILQYFQQKVSVLVK